MSGGNGAAFSEVDVAVVGGGIVGSSAAFRLAERGLKVALFERGTIASEQSSRAWGFVRQQGRHEAEVPLASEANRLWIELTARFGESATGFAAGGILVPAETEADEERVTAGHEIATRFQLRTRILDRDAMRELVPELAGNWRSGLFTAGDAHAEPGVSTQTIANAARAAGVTVNEQAPVITVDTEGGRARGVVTANGRCRAGVVLLASGIGTPRLARPLGHNLPIQVIRSSVGLTQAAKPFTKVAMWAPRVAYRPRQDGSFIIGNGYRGLGADYDLTFDSLRNLRHFLPAYRNNWRLLRLSLGGAFLDHLRANLGTQSAARPLPEPRVNRSKVTRNVAAFNALFPHLGGLPLARAWSGRIDLTPDVIPIIDRPNPNDDLYVAAGFSGHGFALGPSIGKQLAEWIVDGRPSLDLKPFRLARFVEGDVNRNKQAL
jgi:glycine/D-amino acid oxidase-like deaminating enzyme